MRSLTRRVIDELSFLLPRFEQPMDDHGAALAGRAAPVRGRPRTARAPRRAAAAAMAVALAGNAYDGVGMPASIGSGRRAATQVLELLPS